MHMQHIYVNCVGCYFWKHFLNFSIFSPLIVCNDHLPTFVYPWKCVSFHPPCDDLKRWKKKMLQHLECLCSWSFNFAQYPSFSGGGASIKTRSRNRTRWSIVALSFLLLSFIMLETQPQWVCQIKRFFLQSSMTTGGRKE